MVVDFPTLDLQETGSVQGAHRLPRQHHRAGAALRDAAAIFGAGQADLVAQRPEQRHFRLDIELMLGTIDLECDHRGFLLRRGDGPARARLMGTVLYHKSGRPAIRRVPVPGAQDPRFLAA